jgi:hypothetical protein
MATDLEAVAKARAAEEQLERSMADGLRHIVAALDAITKFARALAEVQS